MVERECAKGKPVPPSSIIGGESQGVVAVPASRRPSGGSCCDARLYQIEKPAQSLRPGGLSGSEKRKKPACQTQRTHIGQTIKRKTMTIPNPQFSLRALLWFVTGTCLLLAFAVAILPDLLGSETGSILLIVAFACYPLAVGTHVVLVSSSVFVLDT